MFMPLILIVEDNESVLDELVLGLELRGYEVIASQNGRVALDYLEDMMTQPDLIMSDISMPEISGYQLLEQVQTRWADIPFIFLTGFASLEDIRKGKQLGADDYIVKPFEIDDVVIAIENKLRRLHQWRNSTSQQVKMVRQELLTLIQGEINVSQSDIQLMIEELESMPSEFSYRALEALRQQARSINRLVEQIVLLTKMDRGYFKHDYEAQLGRYKISTILEAVFTGLREEFNEESLVLRYEPNDISVVGIQELLIAAFTEVLRNAFLFSIEEPVVAINTRIQGAFIVVRILDHGVGITEADLPYVWERFVRLYPTGKPQQGAGVGLSIAYQCLQLHNGSISIESRPNVGTVVTLSFRVA